MRNIKLTILLSTYTIVRDIAPKLATKGPQQACRDPTAISVSMIQSGIVTLFFESIIQKNRGNARDARQAQSHHTSILLVYQRVTKLNVG